MSTQNIDNGRVTLASNADLSAKQFYIVKETAANTVGLAAAATDKLLGVITNKPNSKTGSPVEVVLRNASGWSKVIAGGNIAIGDALTANSSGKAIATTTAGDHVLGVAKSAAASGDIVEYFPAGVFTRY